MYLDLSYINLKRAEDRRECIEKSIRDAHFSNDIVAQRFEAIEGTHELVKGIKSPLLPNEVACFVSHRECLKSFLHNENHLMIAEDDAVFSPKTEYFVNDAIKQLDEQSWDILFTDLVITHVQHMAALINQKKQLSSGLVSLINISETKMPFFGTTCYIINGKSKHKIANFFSSQTTLPIAYDSLLRIMIHEKKILGFFQFPFTTTLSELGDRATSTIYPGDRGTPTTSPESHTMLSTQLSCFQAWSDFRRVFWIGNPTLNF